MAVFDADYCFSIFDLGKYISNNDVGFWLIPMRLNVSNVEHSTYQSLKL